MTPPTLDDVRAARTRIRDSVPVTALIGIRSCARSSVSTSG